MDVSEIRNDFLDYSPATSTTATLAPPSPETEQPPTMAPPETLPPPRRSPDMQQYAAVGQLKYAPATQTTVVTTTTTTTTSFPPLLMRAPRHLHNRDPKQYPLAASPTPESIRKFSFDVDGQPVCFSETEDVEGSLLQFSQQYTTLNGHNGTVQAITNSGIQYETPRNLSKHRSVNASRPQSELSHRSVARKRPASEAPVSLAEAAVRALDSGSPKRPKTGESLRGQGVPHPSRPFSHIHIASPATPESRSNYLKTSKSRLKAKREDSSRPTRSEAGIVTGGEGSAIRPGLLRSKRYSSRAEQLASASQVSESLPTPTSATDAAPLAVSTTPPMAEDDFEPIDPQETSAAVPQFRPTALDTLVAQDVSLPSPSLSPITAAANLHNMYPHRTQGTGEEQDDADEVSSLDIPPNASTLAQLRRSRIRGNPRLSLPHGADIKDTGLPTPTVMDIPNMLDAFDGMPEELQSYVIFQLLKRCNKTTLQHVANVVNPALKCDFLALLPLELSMNIVRYLDVVTMCRAAQVSKKWRQIVDSDETAWKMLLERDGLVVPEGEIERAVKEGWGWQYPLKNDYGEQDLSSKFGARTEEEVFSPTSNAESEYGVPQSAGRPKRKAANKGNAPSKKRKTKTTYHSTTKQQVAPWVKSLEDAQGPIAHANAAAMAVPNPTVGLASLRNLHLYKSIYRRHHAIKKGWMEQDTQPHHIAFRAHGRHVVTCLQFDSEKIVTGSDDTNIHIYDTRTGQEIKTLKGHEGGVWALQYDGNILVSGSTDRSVRVWDIEKGKCIQQFQGHTSTVRCLVILKPTKVGEDERGQPIMMPKEPLIITGSRDSTLRVWRLPSLGDRSVIQTGQGASDSDNPYFIRALTGHMSSVRALAAHGDTLVSGSYDHNVRIWKISTGDLLHRMEGHTAKVYSVVLDHERNRCISGSMDNTVRIWSTESGQQLFHLDGHTSLVGLLDLGHGRLVSAAADSTLRIWDPENGHCKNTLSAHTGAITCFQHDDQKVISGSDRTLKLWNVKTGECVKDLLTDLSGVWQVKFNERRCVAAVQRDNNTYIEVLDFGAARDGVPASQRGTRIVVDRNGEEGNADAGDGVPANDP